MIFGFLFCSLLEAVILYCGDAANINTETFIAIEKDGFKCVAGLPLYKYEDTLSGICALQCLNLNCEAFNFRISKKTCDIFERKTVYNVYNDTDCKAFQAIEQRKLVKQNCDNLINPEFFLNKTIPDNRIVTCPLYDKYPQAIAGSKKPSRFNLAMGRPVYASSVDPNAQLCRAVDGNTDQYLGASDCFATDETYNRPNWLIVDLQDTFRIDFVSITNRMDYSHRLERFYVGLLKAYTPNTNIIRGTYPLCGQYAGPTFDIKTLDVKCEYTNIGRYVVIQNVVSQDYLNLCEVEVFGNYQYCYPVEKEIIFLQKTYPDAMPFTCQLWPNYPNNLSSFAPINLALGRPVYASSMFPMAQSMPCNLVDGNLNGLFDLIGSCFSTNNNANEWLVVDLQANYNVKYVVLTNRVDKNTERLSNIDVRTMTLFNQSMNFSSFNFSLCATNLYSSVNVQKIKLVCLLSTQSGRYVSVTRSAIINICEIEVYGSPA